VCISDTGQFLFQKLSTKFNTICTTILHLDIDEAVTSPYQPMLLFKRNSKLIRFVLQFSM
jgi:hypothetical protein